MYVSLDNDNEVNLNEILSCCNKIECGVEVLDQVCKKVLDVEVGHVYLLGAAKCCWCQLLDLG